MIHVALFAAIEIPFCFGVWLPAAFKIFTAGPFLNYDSKAIAAYETALCEFFLSIWS